MGLRVQWVYPYTQKDSARRQQGYLSGEQLGQKYGCSTHTIFKIVNRRQ